MNKRAKLILAGLTATSTLVTTALPIMADEGGGTGATGLIPAEAISMIEGFSGQLIPTAMQILLIVLPVSLACWGIGFAVRKGIGFLKKQASKTM